MRAALVLAAFTFAPAFALAHFTGRVVKVQDGDSLTILVNKRQIRVQLESIDPPELNNVSDPRSSGCKPRGLFSGSFPVKRRKPCEIAR
jgi:endonuclease YncB( thermonuclease family)